jgi:hypothetical protein
MATKEDSKVFKYAIGSTHCDCHGVLVDDCPYLMHAQRVRQYGGDAVVGVEGDSLVGTQLDLPQVFECLRCYTKRRLTDESARERWFRCTSCGTMHERDGRVFNLARTGFTPDVEKPIDDTAKTESRVGAQNGQTTAAPSIPAREERRSGDDRRANEVQVGGTHYGLSTQQHWDLVVKFDWDYFQGQITKYVMRHKKKNKLEDLKKAKHFLEKYIEEYESGRLTY